MSHPLLTVGHSNLEAEGLAALLRGAGVAFVADVRSMPYSKRLPHFSREVLEAHLKSAGIGYVFLGRELGGRPEGRALYTPEGVADYQAIRATPAFRQGVEKALELSQRQSVALMCGEEDPLPCHRGLMITPALSALGRPPWHLRRGGRLESPQEFEARVLEAAGLGGLFQECLEDAFHILSRRHAHRLEM
jgi:uncharacterized protein (DUF488 family)